MYRVIKLSYWNTPEPEIETDIETPDKETAELEADRLIKRGKKKADSTEYVQIYEVNGEEDLDENGDPITKPIREVRL